MKPPSNATEVSAQEWGIKMAARKAFAKKLSNIAQQLLEAAEEAQSNGISGIELKPMQDALNRLSILLDDDTNFLDRNKKHLIGQPLVWQSSPSTNQ